MSDGEAIAAGVTGVVWGVLLLVFNEPLGEAYRGLWPDKYGPANAGRGWHRKEVVVIAAFFIAGGLAALLSLLT